MDNIIRILNVFYLESSLKININKSNLYGLGVPSSEFSRMATGTGCLSSSLPFSYLGLLIGSNMGRIDNWKILIDRFKSRFSGWKANLLSSGGRITLIKSVLRSLDIYYFSIFKAPEAVTKFLESLCVGSLKAFNNSLLLKWRWRLLKNPYALWVKVVKLIHGDEAGWRWLFDSLLERHLARIHALLFSPVNGGRSFANLDNLLADISSLIFSNGRDYVTSSFSMDVLFSIKDVRKHINDCMLLNTLSCTRWYKTIPQKVNIWHLFLDRFPRHLNISSQGLDIDSIMCPMCNKHVESNAHVFFSFDIASSIWSLV
ncbi:reverse transcriptase domain, reverse transcriptase zinc-binding domain protein [Tanacetum coccineum]